ncbi:MAG TPA: thiamine phosphate synthase [Acidimicrobiales bacterium]
MTDPGRRPKGAARLVVVVTDRAAAAAGGRRLVDVVAASAAAGAGAVLLREKDLPRTERRDLARELRAVTARAGTALWVAGDAGLAREVGADALHLAAADPWPAPGAGIAAGRSCHTVAELVAARQRGAAHATYSPVFATASKPGYGPPLGPAGLAAGCRAVPDLRVIALGGIVPGRVATCAGAGAAGVALMGAVMRADDPAAVVASVVDELRAREGAGR